MAQNESETYDDGCIDGEGWVYFLSDTGDHSIKIGWSGTREGVEKRRRQLQTGRGYRFVILAMMPGSKADEGALHERCSEYRIARGGGKEWFLPAWIVVLAVAEAIAHGIAGRQVEIPCLATEAKWEGAFPISEALPIVRPEVVERPQVSPVVVHQTIPRGEPQRVKPKEVQVFSPCEVLPRVR